MSIVLRERFLPDWEPYGRIGDRFHASPIMIKDA